ncbi:hypothetical protein M0R72_05865 [Candidatus Pacearchaeota archaeon]|jgi:hypothetical protein|nr:hypothetical protein [Candidatus Pacearchaeota archaeon]
MGHYVSFWGFVPGRDIPWGEEASAIRADVESQCQAKDIKFSNLLVMAGGSGKGIIQTSDGRRFFVGSHHGLIELPEGVECPHRSSIGYHSAGEIPCPLCKAYGPRITREKLGWEVP